MPGICVRRNLTTSDFDELAHAFRGWDARFRQFSGGVFHGELQLVQIRSIQIMRVRSNRKIQARGLMQPGWYGFTAVTPSNAGATWRGQHLTTGQINVNHPGDVMDHLTAAPYETLMVGVDGAALREAAWLRDGTDVEERLRDFNSVRVSPVAVSRLNGFLQGLLDKRGVHGGSERACLELLLQTLEDAETREEKPMRPPHRLVLVRRLEEYMRAHLAAPLLAEDLCRESGVSERTLRYAFQETFGLSPMAYFKTAKLNAVRQVLKACGRGATIHEIAGQWGFEHTGNFAADYRRLFGELPSQTLAG